MKHDDAGSNAFATILLVAITIVLVVLVLLLCLRFFPLAGWKITTIPASVVVTGVGHMGDYYPG